MTKQYLTHRCLIAPPDLADDFFANSIIYLIRHDADGAHGSLLIARQAYRSKSY